MLHRMLCLKSASRSILVLSYIPPWKSYWPGPAIYLNMLEEIGDSVWAPTCSLPNPIDEACCARHPLPSRCAMSGHPQRTLGLTCSMELAGNGLIQIGYSYAVYLCIGWDIYTGSLLGSDCCSRKLVMRCIPSLKSWEASRMHRMLLGTFLALSNCRWKLVCYWPYELYIRRMISLILKLLATAQCT